MERMDDLPYKPGKSPAELEAGAKREWEAELKKRAANEKRRATKAKKRPPTARQTTVKRTRSQTAQPAKRPVKKLPPMRTPGEQPRGPDGRWIKVGRAVWTGTKATGRVAKHALFGTAAVIGGTVAAAQAGHRAVKKGVRKRPTGKRRKVTRRRKR